MRGRLIVEQDVILTLRDRTLGDLSLRDVKRIGGPPSHTLAPLTCRGICRKLQLRTRSPLSSRPPSLLAGQSLRGTCRKLHLRRHVASSPSDPSTESQLPGIPGHRNSAQAHAGTRENRICGRATKTGPPSLYQSHAALNLPPSRVSRHSQDSPRPYLPEFPSIPQWYN